MYCVVKIPCDNSKPIEKVEIMNDINNICDNDGSNKHSNNNGDNFPNYLLKHILCAKEEEIIVETTPLKRIDVLNNKENNNAILKSLSGIYAYHLSSIAIDKKEQPSSSLDYIKNNKNRRATCLSLACGLHSNRFYGDVYISRLGYSNDNNNNKVKVMNLSLKKEEIIYACLTPDLRIHIISEIMGKNNEISNIVMQDWILDAAKCNYEDSGHILALASVMNENVIKEKDGEDVEESDDSENEKESEDDESDSNNTRQELFGDEAGNNKTTSVVAHSPLCLHCRRPSNNLCTICKGVYFCERPSPCHDLGWSHQCSCKTWEIYTNRRTELSNFSYFNHWYKPLISEKCYASTEPYKNYLISLGVIGPNNKNNWWNTEIDGWSGGTSASAKNINICERLSYVEGFGLDENSFIPLEEPINDYNSLSRDMHTDMIQINTWEDYYKIRNISKDSPIALLLTFPLTLYYIIRIYGIVPIIVSKMESRAIIIHVVGVEKELNFLDIFKEFAYLLPNDIRVEMAFIVRTDMLPKKSTFATDSNKTNVKAGTILLTLPLTSNVNLTIQTGSYNKTIDPLFDITGGPPDMIIGLNAGLYAYESWRDVIEFLNVHKNIIGAFTDYNEHSGYNCASLGGKDARNSLVMNPFRQPRAMPVYSMNLPQFCNGFIYVFNQQELDY